MESQFVPIQRGYFQAFDYAGNRYYRLSTELGHEWVTKEMTVEFSLSEELERCWAELNAPKIFKFDLDNREMFSLMMDAIKSRKPFDSRDHQPNGSRKFVVEITEDNSAILSVHPNVKIYTFNGVINYTDPVKLAVFWDDKIELHLPPFDKLPKTGSRPKLIKTILQLLSEHFDVPEYIYKEQGKKTNGSTELFTIFKKELFYDETGEAYSIRKGEVVTTKSPLIFNRICGVWYDESQLTPYFLKVKGLRDLE